MSNHTLEKGVVWHHRWLSNLPSSHQSINDIFLTYMAKGEHEVPITNNNKYLATSCIRQGSWTG